jgi:hypothetical protein
MLGTTREGDHVKRVDRAIAEHAHLLTVELERIGRLSYAA